jgi:hypothetical protein
MRDIVSLDVDQDSSVYVYHTASLFVPLVATMQSIFCQDQIHLFFSCSCSTKPQPQTKETSAKVKALNETVLRLNESNSRLQQENKALKEDLSRQLEQSSKEKELIAAREYIL